MRNELVWTNGWFLRAREDVLQEGNIKKLLVGTIDYIYKECVLLDNERVYFKGIVHDSLSEIVQWEPDAKAIIEYEGGDVFMERYHELVWWQNKEEVDKKRKCQIVNTYYQAFCMELLIDIGIFDDEVLDEENYNHIMESYA